MKIDRALEIIQNLDSLRRIEYDSIAKTRALGEIADFKEVAEQHSIVKKFLMPIDQETLMAIPDTKLARVFNPIKNLLDKLYQITQSDLETLKQNRSQLIKEYDESYWEIIVLMGWLYPLIRSFSQETEEIKDMTDDLLKEINEQKKEAEKQKKEFQEEEEGRKKEFQEEEERRKNEFDKIIEAARKSSGEIGVAQESIHFKTIKENHKKLANGWLLIATALGILLFLYGVYLIRSSPSLAEVKDVPLPVLIQTLFGKAVLLGVLGYAIRLCSKNYLANRHNAVIAEHRQTSLSTYRAIVEAAGEQANRDIILLKAADSIFGQHITGFLKGNDGGNSSNSPVNLKVNPRLDTPESN